MNKEQIKLIRQFKHPLLLSLFFARSLPMAWFAGLRVEALHLSHCRVRVKQRWTNKNPFGSIYFAVLAMAAELSTGAFVFLHLRGRSERIPFIVTQVSAEFFKKAKGAIRFSCTEQKELERALADVTRAPENSQIPVSLRAVGHDSSGDVVASFVFEWSFKRKL